MSGVLILARSSAAAAQLSQHISQQLVVKEYLARVKVGIITYTVFTLRRGGTFYNQGSSSAGASPQTDPVININN